MANKHIKVPANGLRRQSVEQARLIDEANRKRFELERWQNKYWFNPDGSPRTLEEVARAIRKEGK